MIPTTIILVIIFLIIGIILLRILFRLLRVAFFIALIVIIFLLITRVIIPGYHTYRNIEQGNYLLLINVNNESFGVLSINNSKQNLYGQELTKVLKRIDNKELDIPVIKIRKKVNTSIKDINQDNIDEIIGKINNSKIDIFQYIEAILH